MESRPKGGRRKRHRMREVQMPEDLVVRYCAPTLAGIKTGSLFSCGFTSREELRADIRGLNRTLAPKGLRAVPLRCSGNRALIYLFRPISLGRDLSHADAACLLRRAGYESTKSGHCILRLMERLSRQEDFPHEIGLFLGYPPEDVRGFIENGARNFKCQGCWKVYGDEDAAKKRFAQYQKCTAVYCRHWNHGKTIAQLAVPVLK